jgi:hypothetical protein
MKNFEARRAVITMGAYVKGILIHRHLYGIGKLEKPATFTITAHKGSILCAIKQIGLMPVVFSLARVVSPTEMKHKVA